MAPPLGFFTPGPFGNPGHHDSPLSEQMLNEAMRAQRARQEFFVKPGSPGSPDYYVRNQAPKAAASFQVYPEARCVGADCSLRPREDISARGHVVLDDKRVRCVGAECTKKVTQDATVSVGITKSPGHTPEVKVALEHRFGK